MGLTRCQRRAKAKDRHDALAKRNAKRQQVADNIQGREEYIAHKDYVNKIVTANLAERANGIKPERILLRSQLGKDVMGGVASKPSQKRQLEVMFQPSKHKRVKEYGAKPANYPMGKL